MIAYPKSARNACDNVGRHGGVNVWFYKAGLVAKLAMEMCDMLETFKS